MRFISNKVTSFLQVRAINRDVVQALETGYVFVRIPITNNMLIHRLVMNCCCFSDKIGYRYRYNYITVELKRLIQIKGEFL